jgi:hypothetical protein
MLIPIRVSIFDVGAAGAPSTTAALLPPGVLVSYSHSIKDKFGFESMQATYVTTLEDALAWFSTGLMRNLIGSGPDGGTIWEGFVSEIELKAGQESRTISLDNMANRIKVKYNTPAGAGGTSSTVSDTTSIAQYGTKDAVLPLGDASSTAANNKAARALVELKQPRASGSIGIATGELGNVELTITGAGWYSTLGWVVTSRASTTVTSTTTQVGALIGTASPGIGATNPFLSTSTTSIASSGISDIETIEADTPYVEKIETLLDQGDSTGNPLSWGVYADRVFVVEASAAATPTTIGLTRSIAEGVVRDVYSNQVNWWDVRPNVMYQVRELLDANPAVLNADTAGRSYISRTAFSIDQDGISLSLEGSNGESIDKIIARVR